MVIEDFMRQVYILGGLAIISNQENLMLRSLFYTHALPSHQTAQAPLPPQGTCPKVRFCDKRLGKNLPTNFCIPKLSDVSIKLMAAKDHKYSFHICPLLDVSVIINLQAVPNVMCSLPNTFQNHSQSPPLYTFWWLCGHCHFRWLFCFPDVLWDIQLKHTVPFLCLLYFQLHCVAFVHEHRKIKPLLLSLCFSSSDDCLHSPWLCLAR